MAVPVAELRILASFVKDAYACAGSGDPFQGYLLLELGVLWAETPSVHPVTQDLEPLDPWARELTGLYATALTRYARRVGVSRVSLAAADPSDPSGGLQRVH